MNTNIKRCTNCLISEHFPGVKLDVKGVCNFCNSFNKNINDEDLTLTNKEKIESVINESKGKSSYDAIVAYSGGKDSSYILYLLKEKYKLNILALMIDNSFIAEQAFINANILTEKLKIDLLILKPNPDFMYKMYNKSIKGDFYNSSQLSRANAACLSCINLINNLTLNEAIIRNIPIIAGGYIGGQIPDQAGIIKTSSSVFKKFKEQNKQFLSNNIDPRFSKYLSIAPLRENQKYPIIINPMLGLKYNEIEIIKTITKYGWEKPADTGQSSSNCLLNDFAISHHFKKYKYHSYEAEICMQVRRGTMAKEEALKKLNDIKPLESFSSISNKLNA